MTYTLQCARDSLFSDLVINVSGLTDSIFISTPVADTIYFWHVEAVDSAGVNSGYQEHPFSFIIDTQSPNTPTLISPINGVFLNDTVVTFEWTEVTFDLPVATDKSPKDKCIKNETSFFEQESGVIKKRSQQLFASEVRYVLEVDTTINFTTPILIDTTDTIITTIYFTQGYPYYWRVKAYDLAGNQSPFASPDSFGVDISAPLIESTTVWIDTTYAGPFEIQTKVVDNLAGTDSVILYYQRDEDSIWVSLTMKPDNYPHWYLDTIPQVSIPNDTVRYYIKAVDSTQIGNISVDPSGAPANHYSFLAYKIVGIDEKKIIPEIFRFTVPNNPQYDKILFYIALPDKGMVSLHIYDIAGRLVDIPIEGVKLPGYYRISVSPELSSGVYFYRFTSRWQKKKGKIVFIK